MSPATPDGSAHPTPGEAPARLGEALGGRLTLHSPPQEGTLVQIQLPVGPG